MKYRVYISTLPDIKGQVKCFKVKSNLAPWILDKILEGIVKNTYYITIKEGWKGRGFVREIPFDEFIVAAKEHRFYKRHHICRYEPEFEELGKVEGLPSLLEVSTWRSDTLGYRPRTFFKFEAKEDTIKPNIKGIINIFNSLGINIELSKTPNILWTFDHIILSAIKTEDPLYNSYIIRKIVYKEKEICEDIEL